MDTVAILALLEFNYAANLRLLAQAEPFIPEQLHAPQAISFGWEAVRAYLWEVEDVSTLAAMQTFYQQEFQLSIVPHNRCPEVNHAHNCTIFRHTSSRRRV